MRRKKYLVFYFHGYGASAKSEKFDRLKAAFPETFSWDINIDPDISLPFLESKIDEVLMDNFNDCKSIPVFVGVSLGAWYAAKLASKYDSDAVIINPSWNPVKSLEKYDVPVEIRKKYDKLFDWQSWFKYFIGKNDDVIDYTPVRSILNSYDTEWIDGADHRFNGPEFDKVIEYIRSL